MLTYVQLLIDFSLVRSTPKDQAWNSIQVIEHCLDGVSNPKSRGSDTWAFRCLHAATQQM